MTRRFQRSICKALIGVVLLAQMAIAAYACPAQAALGMPVSSAAATEAEPAGMADAGAQQPMAGCEGMAGAMDTSFPNLCAGHCQHGQQSDQAATLTVPAALLNALYVMPPAPEPIVAPRPAAEAKRAMAAASRPLAILHCCFRI